MNMNDIFKRVAKRNDMAVGDVKKVFEDTLEVIEDELLVTAVDGDKLKVGSLGTLKVSLKPDRMVRNPSTNQQVKKEANYALAFSLAGPIKKLVASKKVS